MKYWLFTRKGFIALTVTSVVVGFRYPSTQRNKCTLNKIAIPLIILGENRQRASFSLAV